jgi:hypothetical protein
VASIMRAFVVSHTTIFMEAGRLILKRALY